VVRFTNNVVVSTDFWYMEEAPQKIPARKGCRHARAETRCVYVP